MEMEWHTHTHTHSCCLQKWMAACRRQLPETKREATARLQLNHFLHSDLLENDYQPSLSASASTAQLVMLTDGSPSENCEDENRRDKRLLF